MPEAQQEFPQHILLMAGHLKDAWLHTMLDAPPPARPSDKEFESMASYVSSKVDCGLDENIRLRTLINHSLDVRDPSGIALRHVAFRNAGHMRELQHYLMNALYIPVPVPEHIHSKDCNHQNIEEEASWPTKLKRLFRF